MPWRASCQGFSSRCFSRRFKRPLGAPTRYCTGGSLLLISARTASVGTPRSPEPIQLKVPPQLSGQPAGAPLPWPTQPQLRQAKLHDRGVARNGLAAILREQRQRPWASRVRVENLDRLSPGNSLRGVDLAQIQDVPLHHSAIVETLVLDDVPIAVGLAVLLSLGPPQEHGAAILCTTCHDLETG